MPYEPEHPVFKKPEDEGASLWRYMDFTKLMWMVEHAALFFARADLLGDPFEGSYSRANLALRPVWYGEEGVPEEIWKGLDAPRKHFLRSTFINAWHMNNYESAAMWRLYLKTDEGIAIRSTFARLCESLKDAEPHVFVGLVNYLDYDLDAMPEGNTMWPFVCKRKSFEHERELRAVIQDFRVKENLELLETLSPEAAAAAAEADPPILPPPAGIVVPVPLDTLVERIYVAPTAPEWFRELVAAVAERYELAAPVIQSELAASPVY